MNVRLADLAGMRVEGAILEKLGRLAKSLNTAYSQILKTMRGGNMLRMGSYNKGINVDHVLGRATHQKFMNQHLIMDEVGACGGPHILSELCCNLVAWDSELMVARFSHPSVHEVLETMFSTMQTNTMAAERCLSCFDPTLPPRIPLVYYSARY